MDNKKYTILYRPRPYDNIRELVHALTMRISSYGCTWEVLRGLKKLELLAALSKFPTCTIIRYAHSEYGPIL